MPRVFIDPGHGGHDYGSVVSGTRESDLTWEAGSALYNALCNVAPSTGWVAAKLSRSRGTDPPVWRRGQMSGLFGADLVLIPHADAGLPDVVQRGATVFYWPGSKGETAARAIYRALPDGVRGGADIYPADERWPGVMANLRAHRAPAVLVEMGFLTHEPDRQALLRPWVQRAFVAAYLAGVSAFFDKHGT